MAQIGIHRYKVSTLPIGQKTVYFLVNGIRSGTATINVRAHCDNYKLLKYLNAKGQYRFFNFNSYFQESRMPDKIGSVNNFFDSLLTGQSNEKNIGYDARTKIELTAEHVSDEELYILSDIYTSPRVYLKIGATDTDADWLLVDVSGDGIVKRRKLKNGKVSLTLTLPKHYSITMQ
jgi:hypothetical protein